MRREVFWASAALDDLDRGIAYIAERSPCAARRVQTEVREAVIRLGRTPTGRRGRVAGTYGAGRPCIVAYALRRLPSGGEGLVLRIIHAARNWPEGEWPEG